MVDLNDLRERITRAEENIINSKETFAAFKRDDFGFLRKEVAIALIGSAGIAPYRNRGHDHGSI